VARDDKILKGLMAAAGLVTAMSMVLIFAERAGYSPPRYLPAAVGKLAAGEPEILPHSEGTTPECLPTTTSDTSSDATQGKLNLNTATLEQLMELPGIGPVIAQNILDYRRQVGRFTSVEQLIYVERIGEKTLAELRDLLTV
jgi:comEA protein